MKYGTSGAEQAANRKRAVGIMGRAKTLTKTACLGQNDYPLQPYEDARKANRARARSGNCEDWALRDL
jgi:hypothetical protein